MPRLCPGCAPASVRFPGCAQRLHDSLGLGLGLARSVVCAYQVRHRPDVARVVAGADAVIFCATSFGEGRTKNLKPPTPSPKPSPNPRPKPNPTNPNPNPNPSANPNQATLALTLTRRP